MAWPPPIVCRRLALFVFGASLMIYLTFSGMLFALGLDVRAALIVAQLLALLGFSVWIARLLRIPMVEAFSLRAVAPVHWAMVFAAAIPLQIAGGALQFALLGTLAEDSPIRQIMEQTMTQFVAVDTTFDWVMLFAAAVLTAAVCEEFLFRGLILQLLRRRSGWTSAIVWSSVLFAVYHLNPVVLLPVALVGMYLALLVARSGSIYPAIVGHALNNGLALFGLPLLVSEAAYQRYLWVTLVSSTVVFLVMLRAYLRATPSPVDEQFEVGWGREELAGGAAPPAAGGPGILEDDRIDGGLGDREQSEQSEQSEQ